MSLKTLSFDDDGIYFITDIVINVYDNTNEDFEHITIKDVENVSVEHTNMQITKIMFNKQKQKQCSIPINSCNEVILCNYYNFDDANNDDAIELQMVIDAHVCGASYNTIRQHFT